MKWLTVFVLVAGVAVAVKASDSVDSPVFAFYVGESSPKNTYDFQHATDLLQNPKFIKSKPAVIFIHDFTEDLNSDSVKRVVDAYIQRNDHNIIVLDWHAQAGSPYLENAVPNVYTVGEQAAEAVFNMSAYKGLKVESLHIVGYGLGGQMAGVIGRTVKKLFYENVIVDRISALDPSKSGFYGVANRTPLSTCDADFVDVIHTDAARLGASVRTGTVDFWPNGGAHPQPGCSNNDCSHARSVEYWIESLNASPENQFFAIGALNWEFFQRNIVRPFDSRNVMGYNTPRQLRAHYYLVTGEKSPYSLGVNGVRYKQ